jgi:signal transduction histidine kinase
VVQDSGPGVPVESLAKLFTPGYRTRAGGYGLGLAVVKAVADLHTGQVEARNRDGGGAEFMLKLPLPDHQPEAPVD